MSQDCAAEEIADELLFKTGKALMARDFGSFSACFGFPHIIETQDARRVLKDMDDLRHVFDDVVHYYGEQGVVDLARTVIEAKFLDADTIGSTHVARLMQAKGVVLRKPFPVYSIIRRHDHIDWKVMSSVYAILDSKEHNAVLVSERVREG